jgi:hypothetical protein
VTASPVPSVARSTATARSVAFAGITLIVSLAAHVAAGGAPPGLDAVVAVLAGGVAAHLAFLARAEQSWVRLAGALLLAQAVVHLSCPRSPGAAAALLSAAPADASCHGVAALPAAALPVHGGGPSSSAMLIGHVVAAVVLGLVLRHGEAVCWSGVWYARVVVARVAALVPSRRRGPRRGWMRPSALAVLAGPSFPVASRLLESCPRHRGPPRPRFA